MLLAQVGKCNDNKIKNFLSRPEVEVYFTGVHLTGMQEFKYEDLAYIFEPYLNKTHSNGDAVRNEIAKLINQHYIIHGYMFSLVTDYKVVGNNLMIHITEGSIKDIILSEDLKNIKYIKEYIEEIKAIRPFNLHKAEVSLSHIKRLLGKHILMIPMFLDITNPQDSNIANVVIVGYKKVKGRFAIDNYFKSLHSTNTTIYNNALLSQYSEYYTAGDIVTTIYNPYNQPSSLSSKFATSLDKKENSLFAEYAHQINQQGTVLTLKTGYDRIRINTIESDFIMLKGGLLHPLILKEKEVLELIGDLVTYTSRKTHLPAFIVKNVQFTSANSFKANNTLDVYKAVIGVNYELSSFLNSTQRYALQTHFGKSSLKYKFKSDLFSNKNAAFNKLTFNAGFSLPLPQEFYFDLNLNSQYAFSYLPKEEYFGVGKNRGGRGFLPNEIIGKNGVSTAFELSHNDVLKHPFLYGIREFIYLDMAKVSKTDTGRESLTSVGLGSNFYIVDNLVVNLELNKPLTKRDNTKPGHRNLKILAGLKYNFSF